MKYMSSLRIQVCPKISGLTRTSPIVGMGCLDHQSYSKSGGVREFLGFLEVQVDPFGKYSIACSIWESTLQKRQLHILFAAAFHPLRHQAFTYRGLYYPFTYRTFRVYIYIYNKPFIYKIFIRFIRIPINQPHLLLKKYNRNGHFVRVWPMTRKSGSSIFRLRAPADKPRLMMHAEASFV